jgi:hypothetical protein
MMSLHETRDALIAQFEPKVFKARFMDDIVFARAPKLINARTSRVKEEKACYAASWRAICSQWMIS